MPNLNYYKMTLENLLLEGQNYEAMFNNVISFLQKFQTQTNEKGWDVKTGDVSIPPETINEIKANIKTIIEETKSKLKKNDRIVWFLKLYRIHILCHQWHAYMGHDDGNFKKQIQNILSGECKQFDDPSKALFWGSARDKYGISNYLDTLAHFLSLPIKEIQNTVFLKQLPNEITDQFREYERKWEQERSQIIDPDETHTAVLTFPDGKVWFNLNKEYCKVEGGAMGHCGNSASPSEGDNVLSLREPVGQKWRPLLTFILHKNGFLGEMKGRANEKPAVRYHPYIIELLKQPFVKGVAGGGYAPAHNFELKDLTEDQQKELFELKPALAPISYQYKKTGMTEELLEAIKMKLQDVVGWFEPNQLTYLKDQQEFIVDPELKLSEFLKERDSYSHRRNRDNSIEWMYGQVRGDGDPVFFEGDVGADDLGYLYDNLSENVKIAIVKYVKKNYKETFELDDNRGIIGKLRDESDDLYDELKTAYARGWETGTQDDIYNELTKTLEKWHDEQGFHLIDMDYGDDKAKLAINEGNFVSFVSDESLLDSLAQGSDHEWIVEESDKPHFYSQYGFSEVNYKAAEEYFLDESEILVPFMPKKKLNTPKAVEESVQKMFKKIRSSI